MPIFLSLLLTILSFHSFGKCGFKKDIHKVISLSGPISILLHRLDLLSDPKVKGLSVFHPFDEKDFKGTFYPGGVFLSRSVLEEFEGGVVFYDESRELGKLLQSHKGIKAIEVKTRNETPLVTVNKTLEKLRGILEGCDQKTSEIVSTTKELQSKILGKLPERVHVVFYLGEIRNKKRPELVMVNDGVVKWLKDEKAIETYPSDLSYVNWSAKMISNMPSSTMHVGVMDSGRKKVKKIKRSPEGMTLIYPGVLIPGLTQLEGFLYWLENR